MEKIFKARQKSVLSRLPSKAEAFMITGLPNVHYLCGYSGSCGVLILEKTKTTFFTDFRYQEQSAREIGKAAEIIVYKKTANEAILAFLKKRGIKALGIEDSMTVGQYELLKSEFGKTLIMLSGLPEKARQIKDDGELVLLRKAFQIGDKSFAKIARFLKPGLSEIEVAAKLEYEMKKAGSEKTSFDTIIAAGSNASCPHAHPTEAKIKAGSMVKIDFGAVFHGYHSDMTRTVFMGKTTKKFRDIYSIVLEAQRRAIKGLKVGAFCREVDAIARDYIASKGFGENFGHGLGHALGLEIHESPNLSFKTDPKTRVEAGQVFTVEPGIYLPGWGGIRIEDVFVVRETGLEKLTNTPNELLEIL